ncbi:MAG: M16 family metallopeptidase [Gemmatimonadota bacterium]
MSAPRAVREFLEPSDSQMMNASPFPGARLAAALAGLLLAAPGAAAQVVHVDRSAPPEIGPPPALRLPAIQRLHLSNGVPVVLMEKHEVPLVQVDLLVREGSVNDPADRRGLADLTLAMLREGAGDRDALELADAIGFLGVSLSTTAGYHTSSVSLHTPLSKLDEALGLMADVVLRPTFPPPELDRMRLERLTELVQAHDNPRAIAPVLFDRLLYGNEHPYGPPADPEAALRSVGVEDLRAFYGEAFRPGNAMLVVVGDVTPESLRPRLEEAFGSWSGGETERRTVPSAAQVRGRKIYLVDKPGAAQSVIRIGRIGAPRLTDDYFAITVMNTILGGSFTSRLNQNLREDKGYTYGAGSFFAFRPAPGPFVASADVQTDVTGPALAEFMKELEGIRSPVPDDELDRARNYVALRYPRSFQTVRQVAGQLENLLTYGLPDTYFGDFTRHILDVTKDDVLRAARRYVDPDNLVIVVVGDRAAIEDQVRALDLGPIELLSVTDVLGPVPSLD